MMAKKENATFHLHTSSDFGVEKVIASHNIALQKFHNCRPSVLISRKLSSEQSLSPSSYHRPNIILLQNAIQRVRSAIVCVATCAAVDSIVPLIVAFLASSLSDAAPQLCLALDRPTETKPALEGGLPFRLHSWDFSSEFLPRSRAGNSLFRKTQTMGAVKSWRGCTVTRPRRSAHGVIASGCPTFASGTAILSRPMGVSITPWTARQRPCRNWAMPFQSSVASF